MEKKYRKAGLSLILFWLISGLTAQTINLNSITQKEWPNAACVIIFDSTSTNVMPSGLSHMTQHKLIKIMDDEGAKSQRLFTIGYDPLSAFTRIDKIFIHRANGATEVYDTSKVADYAAPARMIYWGAREKMADLGRLYPGDAIEIFTYRKGFTYALLQNPDNSDDKYIPPMRGHFYDIVSFAVDYPTLRKAYIATVPSDKKMQYEIYNGKINVTTKVINENTRYTFSKDTLNPLPTEPNMVAMADVAPKVLMSTSPDWKAKSVWFCGVNEDYGSFKSNKEINRKVKEILKEAKTEEDSISLLTHWVADEIRYSGLSMGEGEGYTLHSGDMNFTDRCGVCKDKAGMLITMLRAAGFTSYPAMTMAGEKIFPIPADQFNHSVTVVKRRNGQYQLLDPTWVPFTRELWSSLEQQQNYLMGLPNGADLMITPVSPDSLHWLKGEANWVINENGTITGSITIEGEGQSDAAVRGLFANGPARIWKDNLEREILRVYPSAKLLDINWTDPDQYLKTHAILRITLEIPQGSQVTNQTITVQPILTGKLFQRLIWMSGLDTKPVDRKYPFKVRCSQRTTLTENYTVPKGYKLMNQPAILKVQNSSAAYFKEIRFAEGACSITETTKLTQRVYEPTQWADVKQAASDMKSGRNQVMVLSKD